MTIGDKLKQIRKEKGLTQDYVAEVTGIGRSNLSRYETNAVEPTFPTISKLAKIYNVDIGVLTGQELDITIGTYVDSLISNQNDLSSEQKKKIAHKLIEIYNLTKK